MTDTGANDTCVFCEIVAGRIPCDKVAEDATTLAFMDIDPGADGHLLVIPKHHSADLLSVSPEDLTATTLIAQRIAKAMYTQLRAEGVNLLNCCGTAGWQTVFHLHLHVIPWYPTGARTEWSCSFEPGLPSDADARAQYARLLLAVL